MRGTENGNDRIIELRALMYFEIASIWTIVHAISRQVSLSKVFETLTGNVMTI